MSIGAYIVWMYLVSLPLAYVVVFNEAAKIISIPLSGDGSDIYHASILPPSYANWAIVVYVTTAASIAYGFWKFGWGDGIFAFIGTFFAMSFNKARLLPKLGSQHYRGIVTHSMISRYADYVRDGDQLRASAMGDLLEKMGFPPRR